MNLSFSDVALEEIEEMKKQCLTALDIVKNEEGSDMTQVLFEASAAEQKIDDLRDTYFKKQMQHMKKGKCKPQSGIIFTEMLTDFERMGDHVKNIAQQYTDERIKIENPSFTNFIFKREKDCNEGWSAF